MWGLLRGKGSRVQSPHGSRHCEPAIVSLTKVWSLAPKPGRGRPELTQPGVRKPCLQRKLLAMSDKLSAGQKLTAYRSSLIAFPDGGDRLRSGKGRVAF